MFIVILILLLIVAFIIYKYVANNYKLKYDAFTFFSGSLGSGKTTMLTKEAIKEMKRRYIYNYLRYPLIILMLLIPIFNIFIIFKMITQKKFMILDKRNTDVYSTYPIVVNFFVPKNPKKYKYSYVINKEVLNWLYRIPNDKPIIVLDEMGYLFPSDTKKTDQRYTFCLAWFRHATEASVFTSSQSMSEVNITFRRKVNHCYQLCGLSRTLFSFIGLTKVSVIEYMTSEDITTITSGDTKDINSNYHYFFYPKNRFSSRYARCFYTLSDNTIERLSFNYEYALKLMNLNSGDKWHSLEYEIIDQL